MTYTTKYNVGDTLLFLEGSAVRKKEVKRIAVEHSRNCLPIATYFFDNDSSSRAEIYKYESEVAATIEELINRLHAIE